MILIMDIVHILLFKFLLLLFASLQCDMQPTTQACNTPQCDYIDTKVRKSNEDIMATIDQLQKDAAEEKKQREKLEKELDVTKFKLAALSNRPLCCKYDLKYTVENFQTDSANFNSTLSYHTTLRFFYDMMKEAAGMNSMFNFTSQEYPPYGEMITSVNGVQGNNDKHLFWAFLRRDATKDCSLSVGVSSYIPRPDEHIVLQYRSWDKFVPTCDGTPH